MKFRLYLFIIFLFSCSKNDNINSLILVITGPSGVGKTTVKDKLVENFNLRENISFTTRMPRKNEKNGIDYFFINKDQFQEMIKNNEFYEYSEHFNNYYGTHKVSILNNQDDRDLVVVLNMEGSKLIQSDNKKVIKILLYADKETLINRINNRKEKITKNELNKRIEEFDYVKKMQKDFKKGYIFINTEKLTIDEVYNKVKDIYLKNKYLKNK